MESMRESASPAPDEPVDRCFRCGKPTAGGEGLCAECNPGDIGGPTATQVHGTIVAGLGIAFLIVALAARFLVGGGVPFAIVVEGQATRADGSLDIVFSITNEGDREAHPTCTVHRSPEDVAGYVFVGDPIAAGATVEVRQLIPPMPGAGGPGGGTPALVEASCR